ncbi:SDR family oxidoreductase [Calidithermus timidus]|jgi:dTDP-4-dehydrorhamnose reductase|uniref:SDR family oxidoreductase n=1 Tax=Calidithermus timidus TaxID=307124 RepID=UPI00035C5C02|nr:NAD(P)-dependent oxidoreductase [Calidithermus timidus]
MGTILMTGGSGRLGTALRALMPEIVAPPRGELDVTDPESVRRALERHQPKVLLHAAAYTDVARAEQERERCWAVNVGGTRNVVRALQGTGVFLVHISTDYVFWGDRGNYREDDPVGPVRNYYALSKLVAEEVVRVLPQHLIIRTSFRPSPWPYPTAFTDLYTSQDYVEVIAPEIALALRGLERIPYATLHIATERKSVYELAVRTRPEVQPGLRAQSPVALPQDISLDTQRWQSLRQEWGL